MRRYNGIVESESAPSKSDLWMFRGSLKYFGPNGWAEPAAVVTKVNAILSALKVADIMVNDTN